VAMHDRGAPGPTLDDFLARTRKFGVKAERKHLLLPADQIASLRRLADAS
jgi:hypothetical protein